jgi:hypothetical protein
MPEEFVHVVPPDQRHSQSCHTIVELRTRFQNFGALYRAIRGFVIFSPLPPEQHSLRPAFGKKPPSRQIPSGQLCHSCPARAGAATNGASTASLWSRTSRRLACSSSSFERMHRRPRTLTTIRFARTKFVHHL